MNWDDIAPAVDDGSPPPSYVIVSAEHCIGEHGIYLLPNPSAGYTFSRMIRWEHIVSISYSAGSALTIWQAGDDEFGLGTKAIMPKGKLRSRIIDALHRHYLGLEDE